MQTTNPDTPVVDTRMALGRQLTLECYDCERTVLASPEQMKEVFLDAAGKSGATVISSHFHAFEPQGISGVVIISESHFAVHAWPEHDYAAVDIFTCGDTIDFNAAAEAIQNGLGSARTIVSSLMYRGVVNNHGVERMMTVCEDPQNSYSLSWKTRFERTQAYGISVSLDLYGCAADRRDLAGRMTELGKHMVRESGWGEPGELRQTEEKNGAAALRMSFAGGGVISCHADPHGRNVYLDFFAAGYFEPRIAAEAALAVFCGHHYRMQIAIRQ